MHITLTGKIGSKFSQMERGVIRMGDAKEQYVTVQFVKLTQGRSLSYLLVKGVVRHQVFSLRTQRSQ